MAGYCRDLGKMHGEKHYEQIKRITEIFGMCGIEEDLKNVKGSYSLLLAGR